MGPVCACGPQVLTQQLSASASEEGLSLPADWQLPWGESPGSLPPPTSLGWPVGPQEAGVASTSFLQLVGVATSWAPHYAVSHGSPFVSGQCRCDGGGVCQAQPHPGAGHLGKVPSLSPQVPCRSRAVRRQTRASTSVWPPTALGCATHHPPTSTCEVGNSARQRQGPTVPPCPILSLGS